MLVHSTRPIGKWLQVSEQASEIGFSKHCLSPALGDWLAVRKIWSGDRTITRLQCRVRSSLRPLGRCDRQRILE